MTKKKKKESIVVHQIPIKTVELKNTDLLVNKQSYWELNDDVDDLIGIPRDFLQAKLIKEWGPPSYFRVSKKKNSHYGPHEYLAWLFMLPDTSKAFLCTYSRQYKDFGKNIYFDSGFAIWFEDDSAMNNNDMDMIEEISIKRQEYIERFLKQISAIDLAVETTTNTNSTSGIDLDLG